MPSSYQDWFLPRLLQSMLDQIRTIQRGLWLQSREDCCLWGSQEDLAEHVTPGQGPRWVGEEALGNLRDPKSMEVRGCLMWQQKKWWLRRKNIGAGPGETTGKTGSLLMLPCVFGGHCDWGRGIWRRVYGSFILYKHCGLTEVQKDQAGSLDRWEVMVTKTGMFMILNIFWGCHRQDFLMI